MGLAAAACQFISFHSSTKATGMTAPEMTTPIIRYRYPIPAMVSAIVCALRNDYDHTNPSVEEADAECRHTKRVDDTGSMRYLDQLVTGCCRVDVRLVDIVADIQL
jgi:hypothetical protein